MRHLIAVAVVGVLCAGVVHADVSTEDKSQVTFGGVLGRMMNVFGGRAARDGVMTTVAVKGDRKVTRNGQSAHIVDLKEEKVYEVNLKDRNYTVRSFADIRREIVDAQRKAAEQSAKESGAPVEAGGQPQAEVDVDFALKESGQRRVINGFDAREVVMTIAVREKGKTLEQNGGLVMTTNTWLAPKMAAMNEIADFERRYAEKLGIPAMLDTQQMAAVMAMYPMLRDGMKRLQAENVNLDGTAVMTVMTVDAVAGAEQAATQAKPEPTRNESVPRGIGGLAGRLGRRIVQKDDDPKQGPGNRATFLTIQHELLKVSPTANDADLQIPTGFKQK